jgi:hypothetical protein
MKILLWIAGIIAGLTIIVSLVLYVGALRQSGDEPTVSPTTN